MNGEKITISDGKLNVANHPIIPFIEGDGIGPDIWAAASRVLQTAVEKAYDGERSLVWKEVLAGQKAMDQTGEWLPQATLDTISEYLVSIKGPLTTPVGGGIRSLNVALRQKLDLYACVRPVQYFDGVPSPVKNPQDVDMIIFRENTEDIYAGIEFAEGTEENAAFLKWLKETYPDRYSKVRFPGTAGIGIKPVSQEGTNRLVKAAIQYAIDNDKSSVTLVHKGNIMKFTEGAFRDWGYETAAQDFGGEELDGGPWHTIKTDSGKTITIKDVIADAMLQQIILRPKEYERDRYAEPQR